MSIKSKFKTFFFLDDEYENEEEEYEAPATKTQRQPQQQQQSVSPKQNVVSLQSVQKSSKVVLIKPRHKNINNQCPRIDINHSN